MRLSWIILEGLDKTGKSTVAEIYKNKGFEVVHMSAPDKKYTETGYAGPLYIDEVLEMYMEYDARDVIFDRSPYGETIWPHVYGRKPMLDDDDFEVLREFEDKNQVKRILMIDPNAKAHWERCVANNEPLNMQQFKVASALFNKMAHKYNFLPQQLGDYDGQAIATRQDLNKTQEEKHDNVGENKPLGSDVTTVSGNDTRQDKTSLQKNSGKSKEQEKLEQANAINSVLSKRIIRQKGMIFDKLESDIKQFLQQQLSVILGNNLESKLLSETEVQILKLYCQRILEKQKEVRG